MPDVPIRLTRGRAAALLEMVSRGLDEEQASIEDEYRVSFLRDGTVQVDDAELAEPGSLDGLHDRLRVLLDARAAAEIIRRRYLP